MFRYVTVYLLLAPDGAVQQWPLLVNNLTLASVSMCVL
jgi:hypothetical protein